MKNKILNIEGVETKNRDYNKDEFKLASLEVFKFKIRMINSLEIGVNIDIKWDMNHPSYFTHCLVAVAVFFFNCFEARKS